MNQTPHSNLHRKITQDQLDSDSSSNSEQDSPIQEDELQKVITIIKKLHKIDKNKQLSKFKKENKHCNQLFSQMSLFFNRKQKSKANHYLQQKIRRQQNKRKRYQTFVNGTKKENYIKLVQQIKHNNQCIIQGDNQVSFTQHLNQNLNRCHICRQPYEQIHNFYGSLCPKCASLNVTKRLQTANLTGLTALVTGGRIKIGYQICLKLLRDGAFVYATSRFPADSLIRYQQQQDYNKWSHNLHIIQCDFLSQVQVNSLINFIKQKVSKLDILINNAAQTIVRPKQFYTHQLRLQKAALQNDQNQRQLQKINQQNQEIAFPSVFSNQIQIKPQQIDIHTVDQFGQPTDKRAVNSWVQKIQDVSLLDCYTTQVINSIVPFHLISQLKQKMIGSTPSWVINVSSMEGVFYRTGKQQLHPHTNMAKASLNMITRTCAVDFKKQNIYMNSVDTGWVTNQNPYHVIEIMKEKHMFKCPLDCIDGAMRVLDPIYQGVNLNKYPFGQFIKNYQSSLW